MAPSNILIVFLFLNERRFLLSSANVTFNETLIETLNAYLNTRLNERLHEESYLAVPQIRAKIANSLLGPAEPKGGQI